MICPECGQDHHAAIAEPVDETAVAEAHAEEAEHQAEEAEHYAEAREAEEEAQTERHLDDNDTAEHIAEVQADAEVRIAEVEAAADVAIAEADAEAAADVAAVLADVDEHQAEEQPAEETVLAAEEEDGEHVQAVTVPPQSDEDAPAAAAPARGRAYGLRSRRRR